MTDFSISNFAGNLEATDYIYLSYSLYALKLTRFKFVIHTNIMRE